MSLDVGTKHIGIAVSDELGITANGLETLKRSGIKKDFLKLKNIVSELNIERIVVGIPYNTDGTISKSGESIKKFAIKLEKELSLPVDYVNETFTTIDAEKYLLEANMSRKKRKRVIDKLSAVIILQEYLEQKRQME
ncbi:MAG: Holliday junction resolvase RuvX [Candidatus Dadabacteria bacterium]|nr:Holliday junction resolvase RuvX [Candidatus Dadabacteria bacterium]NIT13548.1 Holliday junction resolvase RuvX [Candidatus Dadabacteria bacterium]